MMKDIQIKINKETRMVDLSKVVIGNDSENLQGKLIFSFTDEFVDGQARLEYEINKKSNWIALEKNEESYEVPIKSVLTKNGQINMQLVIDEGIEETDIPVFKSNTFYLYCNSSINAVGEAPQEYNSWIEIANSKLNQIDNLDIDIQDNVVTIIKKDGTKKSENVKGDSYVITEDDYEKIETQVKEDIEPVLENIKDIAETAETIAKGRATGYVFDTVEDLDLWLQDEENTSKLILGDNFYIRATDVPDYWWDGNEKQQLETQKVDLNEYLTKDETIKLIPTNTSQLTNDSDFTTKEYVDGLVGDIESLLGGI